MSRKYSNYKVVITEDENTQIYKAENTNSYLETKDLYSKVKEDNEDKTCKIDFVGITPEGEEGTIFSKEYKQEVVKNERLSKGTDEIILELKDILDNLEEKKVYCKDIECAINKKQDTILHKVENIRVLNISNEELNEMKIAIVDELFDVRTERRKIKNEKNKIDYVYNQCNINSFVKKINNVRIPITNDNKRAKKYNKNLQNGNIFKEINYNSTKQRDNIIQNIKHKYSKIVDDEVNSKLICYKRSGK